MSKNDTQQALVPRLRFPEFGDEREWKIQPLGEVCEILNSRRIPITTKDRNAGPFPYYGASGIVDYVDDFIFDERLVLVGEDGAKWQAFEETAFLAEGRYWVNNHAHVLKSTDLIDTLLVGYLVRSSLGGYVTGAAPPKLTLGKLKRIPIPVPPTDAEQQKIADCLGSLDDLIAAEGRKLAALREHKRGLMQQLFPREGETQPRLRFPEFREDERSRFKTVREFAKVTTGDKDTQNKVEDGEYPFFVRSQNVERIDSFSYDGEAVLTSGDGVGVGENYHYINGRFDFHQRVYCIYDFDDGTNGEFFFHYFSTHFKKRVKQMSAKNSVDSVRMAMITEMPIWTPEPDEQQRIADCLSALDTRIAAQAEKLDGLRTHKRGLMQQLFPLPSQVEY